MKKKQPKPKQNKTKTENEKKKKELLSAKNFHFFFGVYLCLLFKLLVSVKEKRNE